MGAVTLDEAWRMLGDAALPLDAREVPLRGACGSILAQPALSRIDLPRYDTSAMDGYAVHADDCAQASRRPVAFEAAAGAPTQALERGRVARIFTGAEIPRGAAAVIAQEDVTIAADGAVEMPSVVAGSHIRRRGEIVGAGDAVAHSGEELHAARLGLCAAVGIETVTVVPRPRFASVVTGAEVVTDPAALGPGKILDSNGPMLGALAAAEGWSVVAQRTASDTLEALCATLGDAQERADLIVTSGGVSVGDYDLLRPAVEALGGRILFHGVKIKPGKPVLVARLGNAWLVGLPGNPLSALCGWALFVRLLAARLAGRAALRNADGVSCRVAQTIENRGDRELLVPVATSIDDGVLTAKPCASQGSHDLVAAAASDGFVRVAPRQTLGPGSLASYHTWRPDRP